MLTSCQHLSTTKCIPEVLYLLTVTYILILKDVLYYINIYLGYLDGNNELVTLVRLVPLVAFLPSTPIPPVTSWQQAGFEPIPGDALST